MNILRHTDADYEDRVRGLTGPSSLFDPTVELRAREIVEAVRTRGDDALLELTERFEGAKLVREQLPVTTAELMNASIRADPALRKAVALASKNIEAFSRKSLRKNWSARNAQGAVVGEKFDPFQRVGIYIPGGTAPLVSTALMTIVLARVAGCREIVVCTPGGKTREINPALLFAINMAGATEIFRVGGAQAIAAMAFGTATIRRAQKVFGPGNSYVVAAKRLLYGHVAVDLLPGPSEVLVLADETAEARFVAADLLAQAEHGSGAERVWLVTPSGKLMRTVEQEINRQLPKLSRRELIQRALANHGWLIQVKDLGEAIRLANRLAPEHCEIIARDAASISTQILSAGAIFLGPYSPTVLGDYVAGPSHVLPTGGAGASFSGLTVDQFQHRTSVVECHSAALAKSLEAVLQFAKVEGLDAHGHSAALRISRRVEATRAKARRRNALSSKPRTIR